MEVKKQKYFTEKQGELLSLIYPGPIGMGMTITEVAKLLSISRQSAHARLKYFKIRFPEAWQQFFAAREISRKNRIQLRAGAEHGYSIYEPHNWDWENQIKERF